MPYPNDSYISVEDRLQQMYQQELLQLMQQPYPEENEIYSQSNLSQLQTLAEQKTGGMGMPAELLSQGANLQKSGATGQYYSAYDQMQGLQAPDDISGGASIAQPISASDFSPVYNPAFSWGGLVQGALSAGRSTAMGKAKEFATDKYRDWSNQYNMRQLQAEYGNMVQPQPGMTMLQPQGQELSFQTYPQTQTPAPGYRWNQYTGQIEPVGYSGFESNAYTGQGTGASTGAEAGAGGSQTAGAGGGGTAGGGQSGTQAGTAGGGQGMTAGQMAGYATAALGGLYAGYTSGPMGAKFERTQFGGYSPGYSAAGAMGPVMYGAGARNDREARQARGERMGMMGMGGMMGAMGGAGGGPLGMAVGGIAGAAGAHAAKNPYSGQRGWEEDYKYQIKPIAMGLAQDFRFWGGEGPFGKGSYSAQLTNWENWKDTFRNTIPGMGGLGGGGKEPPPESQMVAEIQNEYVKRAASMEQLYKWWNIASQNPQKGREWAASAVEEGERSIGSPEGAPDWLTDVQQSGKPTFDYHWTGGRSDEFSQAKAGVPHMKRQHQYGQQFIGGETVTAKGSGAEAWENKYKSIIDSYKNKAAQWQALPSHQELGGEQGYRTVYDRDKMTAKQRAFYDKYSQHRRLDRQGLELFAYSRDKALAKLGARPLDKTLYKEGSGGREVAANWLAPELGYAQQELERLGVEEFGKKYMADIDPYAEGFSSHRDTWHGQELYNIGSEKIGMKVSDIFGEGYQSQKMGDYDWFKDYQKGNLAGAQPMQAGMGAGGGKGGIRPEYGKSGRQRKAGAMGEENVGYLPLMEEEGYM